MNNNSHIDLIVKIIFTIFVCLLFIVPTLYVTVLYKLTPIKSVDSVLEVIPFLPQNIKNHVEDNDFAISLMQSSSIQANFNDESINQTGSSFASLNETINTSNADETSQSSEPLTSVEATQLVEVPDFSGMNYKQIKKDKKLNKNFNIVFEYQYSDDVQKDNVIGQRVAPGLMLEKGSQINIVISRGKESILLRDVVGMDYDTARELLVFAGFEVSRRVVANDGGNTPNQVFAMSHKANEYYEIKTQIVLSVWDDE